MELPVFTAVSLAITSSTVYTLIINGGTEAAQQERRGIMSEFKRDIQFDCRIAEP
jgi:hypothetical protein